MSTEPNPFTEGPPIPTAQGLVHGRAAFAFIFITVLLDMLALGIIVPVLPKLIIRFEHGDMSMAATQTGIFAFVWAAMQFVFAPVMGRCRIGLGVDRWCCCRILGWDVTTC